MGFRIPSRGRNAKYRITALALGEQMKAGSGTFLKGILVVKCRLGKIWSCTGWHRKPSNVTQRRPILSRTSVIAVNIFLRNLRPLKILKAIATLEHLSYKQTERAENSGSSISMRTKT